MIYKRVSFILALVMVLSMLVGCATTSQITATGVPSSDTQTQGDGVQAPQTVSGEKTVVRGLYMKQAGIQMEDMEEIAAAYEAKNPNIDIQFEYVAYEALHDKIVTAAMAKSGAYDIVLLDGIWPGEFAEAGFILDVTDMLPEDMKQNVYQGALEMNEYKGRYYGVPFLNDVEFFFYNEKMLNEAGYTNPPTTWEEFAEIATAAKEKGIVEYPIIGQFGQTELLVCDYTIYLSAMGGKFFTEDGQIAFNSPEGIAALTYMVEGMKNAIYHPASLESASEEARRIFSQGQSMFVFNWSYVASLVDVPEESLVVGDVKAALIPGIDGVRKSGTVNGGMGLSIMADSTHPKEAWDFLMFVTNRDVMAPYYNVVLPLWKDQALPGGPFETAMPMLFPIAGEQLEYMDNRPIVPYYTQMSEILQREIHGALLGEKTPEQALQDAATAIEAVKEQFGG